MFSDLRIVKYVEKLRIFKEVSTHGTKKIDNKNIS